MKLNQEERDRMLKQTLDKTREYYEEGKTVEVEEDGYQKEHIVICPECVKATMDEEDLGWAVGLCEGNKIHCDIKPCERHRID